MDSHNAHVVCYLQQLGYPHWFDETLDAFHWAALSDVAPIDAAMLLCRHNPDNSNWDSISSDETGATSYEEPTALGKEPAAYKPHHLRSLARRLKDIARTEQRPRTLRDWRHIVRGIGLPYHSWIDSYMEVTAKFSEPSLTTDPATTDGTPAQTPATPAMNPDMLKKPPESAQERQARRYQMCIAAGLVFSENEFAAMPRGIGHLARQAGISTQAFTKDVRAHISRNR